MVVKPSRPSSRTPASIAFCPETRRVNRYRGDQRFEVVILLSTGNATQVMSKARSDERLAIVFHHLYRIVDAAEL